MINTAFFEHALSAITGERVNTTFFIGARIRKIVAAILGSLLLSAFAPVFAAADHHHHDHGTQSHGTLHLNGDQKWVTDEALRLNMGGIRAQIVAHREGIQRSTLSQQQYRELAKEIKQYINTIVAECKLTPEADAMLHLVLADMLKGVDMLEGKGGSKPAEGAHKITDALNAYGRYFDHPGWRELK